MTDLIVNGTPVSVTSDPTTPLLDVLRDELGDLTPKPGCREGRCGACTVLLGDAPIPSCLVALGRVEGQQVTTLEGLGSPEGELDEVQRVFGETGAVQCGICTSGMVMTVCALRSEERDWSRREIQRALVNNLCRCTGYTKILDAVEAVLGRGSRRG